MADGAAFDIDDSTGQIKTKADLNYEAASSYTVIVQVTDGRDDNWNRRTNANNRRHHHSHHHRHRCRRPGDDHVLRRSTLGRNCADGNAER